MWCTYCDGERPIVKKRGEDCCAICRNVFDDPMLKRIRREEEEELLEAGRSCVGTVETDSPLFD